MHLHHLPLRGLTPYLHSSYLQETLARAILTSKSTSTPHKPPPPTILTAEFNPVYTTGRRTTALSPAEASLLFTDGRAEVHPSPRGGLTTFHGPGQLVAYPILDLRAHGLSARSYICLLEKSLIAVCARYGVPAQTTEHTGVWVTAERKIASVGVHLRRNVSSHGVALNVSTDLWWFNRIVACGLADKQMTSLEAEGATGVSVEDAGCAFVEEMAQRLSGVDGVVTVDEESLGNAAG
ncbi:lipoyltransferase [Trichodelitschia bisporula]|uniref:Octanoyltransferase n=1 Tax=Trichodelitschia bisporula TaxID=703511 RepID=A0A6G1HML5_9PEZI|nr:lipoyltransferase [Trichodelitschia bisporula]